MQSTQRTIDPGVIADWLRKYGHSQVLLGIFGGLGTLAAGIVLLVLTWGLTYLVSLFALGPWLGFHHWIHWLAGIILIPALFWGNSRTSREYLSEYSVDLGSGSQGIVSFYLPGVGLVSNVNPLGPGSFHAAVKMITDCLYSGPRVVMGGFGMLGRIGSFRRLDIDGCAAVITALFAAHRKLSFQEIVNLAPQINPTVVFPQLQNVEGVIFLSADPAGLTLSQELRQAITSLYLARG